MSIDIDTRDRLVALEVKVQHLTEKLEENLSKTNEMHELLIAAKGARWVIIGAATIGGFIAAKLSTVLPWLQSMGPK